MLYHTVPGRRTPATHYSSLVHHTLGCLQFRSSLPHIFRARAVSPLPTPLPTPLLPRTAHAEVVAPSPHCISSITTTDPPRLGLLIRHDPPTSVVVTRACAGPYYPRTTTVSVMQRYSVLVFSTITVVIEVLRHRTHYHYSARRHCGCSLLCQRASVLRVRMSELGKLHTFRPAGLPANLVEMSSFCMIDARDKCLSSTTV